MRSVHVTQSVAAWVAPVSGNHILTTRGKDAVTTSNFVWKGAEILAGVESAVVDLVNENAEAVADKARSRVRKRTGNLADSIEVVPATITKRGIEATVRAGLYYGLFEELNKPFLRPAARPRKAKLRKALIELGVKGRFKTRRRARA